jgi:preprotein translocase subunit SecA
MKMFAGDWVQGLLQQMGMDEGEAIESRMVARRIQEAARKIERQAVSDLRANSAEDWLQLNCPKLWRKTQG